MTLLKRSLGVVLAVGLTVLAGCSTTATSPDVSSGIRNALDKAGLKDVSVKQDRDKGVVTLTGSVPTDAEKAEAESIAKSSAQGQVVANEIAVVPRSNASATKTINSDLDKGIENNLDAVLVANDLNKTVKYDVKNSVVTLRGEVDSQGKRTQVEKLATGIPNVQQVVNELQVKNQRATTSTN